MVQFQKQMSRISAVNGSYYSHKERVPCDHIMCIILRYPFQKIKLPIEMAELKRHWNEDIMCSVFNEVYYKHNPLLVQQVQHL